MPVEYWTYTDKGLRKSIRRNQKRLAQHEEKMKNPAKYDESWESEDSRYRVGLIEYWSKEIANFKNQIALATAEIERRRGK